MKKILGFWNRNQMSSPSSSTRNPPFLSPGHQRDGVGTVPSPKHLKAYTAFGKCHKAASLGDVAKVQRRLILGSNGQNDQDGKNRTLLHYACAHGHPDVVTLLIAWNCDIDLRDSDNSTALIKASQYEHEECMAILLEHGADPNAADSSGNTALHYAVWSKNTSMAAKLLAHHANTGIRNKDGFTPLLLAQMENNEKMANILISQRAKTQEVDKLDRKSSRSDSCGSSHSSKEDEGKDAEKSEKHKFNAVDASENMNHGTVALVLQRQDGNADNQQILVEENRESNGPLKKSSNKKDKISRVTNSKASFLSQSGLSEVPAPLHKKKVKEEVNPMFDLNKLILPYEKDSEDCEMLSFDTVLALIEQLRRQSTDGQLLAAWGMQRKNPQMEQRGTDFLFEGKIRKYTFSEDSDSLVIIWCAVHSYKRSLELKRQDCELLTERNNSLKSNLHALQKKLLETVEEKSRLEIEMAKLQAELSNLKLMLENSNLKATIKHQAEEIEQLQRTPSENTKEELKRQAEFGKSLTQSLEEEKRRNSELETDLARFKNSCTLTKNHSDACENGESACYSPSSTATWEGDKVLILRDKLECVSTKLEHALTYWQCLENDNSSLKQKLLDLTDAQKKCEILEERQKMFEEEIFSLKTYMDSHMIELGEVEKYKQAIEEQHRKQLMEKIQEVNLLLQRQTASGEHKEKMRQDCISSMRMDMEQRIKDIEAEMLEIKSQENSTKIQLEIYKQSYQAELKTRESLENELNNISSANVRLQHDNSRLANENKMSRCSHFCKHRTSATERISGGNIQSDFWTHQNSSTYWESLFPAHGLE